MLWSFGQLGGNFILLSAARAFHNCEYGDNGSDDNCGNNYNDDNLSNDCNGDNYDDGGNSEKASNDFHGDNYSNSASADGGPRSRVSARKTLDTSGKFPEHMSAESPSNISPNPSEIIYEVISEVSEP